MNWFIHLAMRTKLFLSFGMMIVFLLAVIAITSNGLKAIHRSQEQLFQNDFLPSVELLKLRSTQNRAHAQLLEMKITEDLGKRQELEKDIRQRTREVDTGLGLVAKALQDHPQELKKFEEMTTALADYRKVRDEQISMLLAGNTSAAADLEDTIQSRRYNHIRDLAIDLGNTVSEQAKMRLAEANTRTEMLSRTFTGISIMVLLLSVGAAIFLSSIIAKPLKEITSAAERIASGDLSVTIKEDDRGDEVGDLTNAFSTMVQYLQNMAAVSRQVARGNLSVTVQPVSDKDVLGNAFVDMTCYLREIAALSKQVSEGDLTAVVTPVSDHDLLRHSFASMLASLRKLNEEVRDGVNILTSSASEILASTSQIATGMSETATSVTETTATVEEIKQTALLSAKKSRNVSENAQKSALVADQGYATVYETMEGINHIKELMETVAESVVLLSEQTQAIGEIITVVNDLAQQSNLLAVNAAIEASKAGEHGKGFAVVAQEIKSLADQSKQATEQVRKILGDIQKATGKSVLAAEQVSKAVEDGVKQTSESGEAIRNLAESISQAAQAAEQIAVSSQQQLAGMEQVAIAMENIKQATQQNVLGTKQAEQAAHSLSEFGKKLIEIVSRFKV